MSPNVKVVPAKDIFAIVNKALSRYQESMLPVDADIDRMSWAMSEHMYCMRSQFWAVLADSEHGKKLFGKRVMNVLRRRLQLTEQDKISMRDWPQLLAKLRVGLAGIIADRDLPDLLDEVGTKDGEMLVSLANHHMGAFASPEQLVERKNDGTQLAEEMSIDEMRMTVIEILRAIEEQYAETIVLEPYIHAYARSLRQWYLGHAKLDFETRRGVTGLMFGVWTVEMQLAVDIIDQIVEVMGHLRLAHAENKSYYLLPINNKNIPCVRTLDKKITQAMRKEDLDHWINHFKREYPSALNVGIDIRRCVYAAYGMKLEAKDFI